MTPIVKELAEKYTSIVQEYLAIMCDSEAVQSSETQSYIVRLGLNTITHIYKLAFNSSKHIPTAINNTQRGIYYFIEYIEQTNKLGVLSSIDYMDAVAFVYDKSLSDLCVSGGSSSAYTNMLSASSLATQISEDEKQQIRVLFSRMSTLCSTIFWFSNPRFMITDHREIAQYLADIILFANTEELADIVCVFLETVQEKMNISKAQYLEILACMTKQLKRASKHNSTLSFSSVRDICLHLSVHYSGYSLEQIAAEEGWKKPAEDLVKIAFRGSP